MNHNINTTLNLNINFKNSKSIIKNEIVLAIYMYSIFFLGEKHFTLKIVPICNFQIILNASIFLLYYIIYLIIFPTLI